MKTTSFHFSDDVHISMQRIYPIIVSLPPLTSVVYGLGLSAKEFKNSKTNGEFVFFAKLSVRNKKREPKKTFICAANGS